MSYTGNKPFTQDKLTQGTNDWRKPWPWTRFVATERWAARLLKQCAEMTEKELMEDVFVEFQFDLCRRCQKAYIANPLGMMG